MPWEINRVHDVKEPWRATDLLQAGVSESLLDDDVDQVLGDRVVLVDEVGGQIHSGDLVLINLDDAGGATVNCRPLESLVNLVNSIDGLAGDDILSKSLLECEPLGADDGMNLVGLPELIGLDVEDVLVDKEVLAQGQLELVGDEVGLVWLDCHLLPWRSVLTASATPTSTASAGVSSALSSLVSAVLSLRSVVVT